MAKVNFTIPEETVVRLNDRVARRRRSAFVAAAIEERLSRIDEDALERELIEGYQATRDEDAAINAEWEAATLEGWPD